MSSWGLRVAVALVVEHICLLIVFMLMRHIADEPDDVELARLAREKRRTVVRACARARRRGAAWWGDAALSAGAPCVQAAQNAMLPVMPEAFRRALETVFLFHARGGKRSSGAAPPLHEGYSSDAFLTREGCAAMFGALHAKAQQIEAAAGGASMRQRNVGRQLTDRHFRMLFDMLDADKRCVCARGFTFVAYVCVQR
jgi:hypothetical protein